MARQMEPARRARGGAWWAGGPRRRLSLAILMLAVPVATLIVAAHPAGVVRAAGPQVDTVQLDADVNPAAAHLLGAAIDHAQSDGATALVIELDTFGGDLASMQTIHTKELDSRVPIIAYVSPAGAHADSAGALIALGAPIVAMSPGTRIGAASPVDATGGDLGATEKAKTTNALVAQVQGDQTLYGREVAPAIQMVTNASAYDAQDAVAKGVVNYEEGSLSHVLARVDGTPVKLSNGSSVTLNVAGLPIEQYQPTVADQLYGVLLDPTVQFILFVVALVCIYLELSHPGAIVPGTVGGIALLLFLFGAGSLSPNWTGLALMLLALVLLAVDVRVPTHGVLTVGALISLVVGSLIFFNSGPPDQAVSPFLIFGLAAGVGLVAVIVLRYAIAASRAKVDTGGQRLVGQVATVISPLQPDGSLRVRVLGEDWSATLVPGQEDDVPTAIEPGAHVRVTGIRGLRLRVRPEPAAPPVSAQ